MNSSVQFSEINIRAPRLGALRAAPSYPKCGVLSWVSARAMHKLCRVMWLLGEEISDELLAWGARISHEPTHV